jgi:hypothetical protein
LRALGGVRCDDDGAGRAVEQHVGAVRRVEDGRVEPDHEWDPEGARDDRGVRGGPAQHREGAGRPASGGQQVVGGDLVGGHDVRRGVIRPAGHVGRRGVTWPAGHVVRSGAVRGGAAVWGRAEEAGEQAATHGADVRGAGGQGGVGQGGQQVGVVGDRVGDRGPGGLAGGERGVDLGPQVGVLGDEPVGVDDVGGLGLAGPPEPVGQGFQVGGDRGERLVDGQATGSVRRVGRAVDAPERAERDAGRGRPALVGPPHAPITSARALKISQVDVAPGSWWPTLRSPR